MENISYTNDCKYFFPLTYPDHHPSRKLISLVTVNSPICPFSLDDSVRSLQYTDPQTGNVTIYNLGDIAWVMSSTALVWLMIPGVGFFYSGLLRRKNALSMIMVSVLCIAVVSFQVHIFSFALGQGSATHMFACSNPSGSSGATRSYTVTPPVHSLATYVRYFIIIILYYFF